MSLKKTKFLTYLAGFTCLIALLGFLKSANAHSEETGDFTLHTPTGEIAGSLEVPELPGPYPVVLIIAGSGPTDRNGNQPFMKSNAYQHLAQDLKGAGAASLRYDKRGIGKSKAAGPKETDLRFEHYVEDAQAWIRLLRQDKRFNQVIVLGHSEGSLIGMMAAEKESAEGYISLAGAGRPAAEILSLQLAEKAPKLAKQAQPILDQLTQGQRVDTVPLLLKPLFRQSVQNYMISWFSYDPRIEIARLKIPVLIIQGTTDIQVSLDDAEQLKQALPAAQFSLVEGMNHILKEAPKEQKANLKTYNQPQLPIHSKLHTIVSDFIQNLQPVEAATGH